MFIFDDLLMAPIKGLVWLGKRVQDAAEGEVYDPNKIKESLLDLQERQIAGEIAPGDFEREEDRLLQLLEAAQRRKNDG